MAGGKELKYDFDKVTDRRGSDSVKWDVKEGELPMWVADMDFRTAPSITDALEKRVSHGIFGYSDIKDDWYNAYISWWKRRHGFVMEKEWLIFCTGVIPAISSAVRKLTTPAENVVIQTPVYNVFFNSILNNGRRVLESPLVYKDGKYDMDLEDLERKFSDPQTTMMILCNPHNPVGKIWDKKTLAAIGELALKYHVTVVSDEIHCDLTVSSEEYVPFASVSETCRKVCVSCVAPTKTFSIPGLQTAAVCVPDEFLRSRMRRALNTDEVAEPNFFASAAAVAAFENGGEWLDELRGYLTENRRVSAEFIEKNIPSLYLIDGKATYLLWIDLKKTGMDSVSFCTELRKKTGLYVMPGSVYGKPGDGFLRMNVACPRSVLYDGLERLKKGTELLTL